MEGKKRIAVVDDDEDILEFIKLALEGEGYDVETKTDGGWFWRVSPDHLPDLLLLDVQLAEGDGRVLCQQLKANERTHHLPIILSSAYQTVSQIRAASGADDALAKPFSLTTLINKVQRLLPS